MALNIEDLLADDGGFPVPTMRRPAPEWSGGMGLSPADLEFEPEVGEEMPGEGGVMSGFWDRFATGLANRPVRGLGLIQALAGGRAQEGRGAREVQSAGAGPDAGERRAQP